MQNVIRKAVTKHKQEVSKCPTLTLLTSKEAPGSRGLSREVELWLEDHDLVYLLEGLASHLLRTLPADEVEECDRYLDAQKLSRATSRSNQIPFSDIMQRASAVATATAIPNELAVPVTKTTPLTASSSEVVAPPTRYEFGKWMQQEVMLLVLQRKPKQLKGTELKGHLYQVTCAANAGPLLANLRHDNVLSTFGYCMDPEEVALVHPRMNDSLRTALKQFRSSAQYLSLELVVRIAVQILSGLGCLHTLGFLHRNLSTAEIFVSYSNGAPPAPNPATSPSPNASPPASPTTALSAATTSSTRTPIGMVPLNPVAQKREDTAVGFQSLPTTMEMRNELNSATFLIGGFSTLVRSSRGRVVVPSWMPTCPAPETLQGRVFDSATDIFSFGLLLVEICNYGDQMNAVPLNRPSNVPPILWADIISRCLQTNPDERPSLTDLQSLFRSVAKWKRCKPYDIVLKPEESLAIDADSISALIHNGASEDILKCNSVVQRGLVTQKSWTALKQLLSLSDCKVEHLTLVDCLFPPSLDDWLPSSMPRKGQIQSLRIENLQGRGNVGQETTAAPSSDTLVVVEEISAVLTGMLDRNGPLAGFELIRCSLDAPESPSKSTGRIAKDQPWTQFLQSLRPHLSNLTKLSLNSADLKPLHWRGLAEVMLEVSVNTPSPFHQLRELDFGGNLFNSDCVSHLCSVLRLLPMLQLLSFAQSAGIDYFSISSVAQLLRANLSIRTLDLSGLHDPPLSETGRRLLVGALDYRRRLPPQTVGPPTQDPSGTVRIIPIDG